MFLLFLDSVCFLKADNALYDSSEAYLLPANTSQSLCREKCKKTLGCNSFQLKDGLCTKFFFGISSLSFEYYKNATFYYNPGYKFSISSRNSSFLFSFFFFKQ